MTKKVFRVNLTKTEKFPALKREFPEAQFIDPMGQKFRSVDDAVEERKQRQDFKRRKFKPKIEVGFF